MSFLKGHTDYCGTCEYYGARRTVSAPFDEVDVNVDDRGTCTCSYGFKKDVGCWDSCGSFKRATSINVELQKIESKKQEERLNAQKRENERRLAEQKRENERIEASQRREQERHLRELRENERQAENEKRQIERLEKERRYKEWYVSLTPDEKEKEDARIEENNRRAEASTRKFALIVVVIAFAIVIAVVGGLIINSVIAKKQEDAEINRIIAERQSLMNYIDSNGSDHCYSYNRTDTSLGIDYTFTLSYTTSEYGFVKFLIEIIAVHDNVMERSWVNFYYGGLTNTSDFYSEVTVDDNKSYRFVFNGIQLLNCPNISNPTSITRRSSSNWDSSLNIYDYTSDCFVLLKAGLTNAHNKVTEYDSNIKLW